MGDVIPFVEDHECNVCFEYNESVTVEMINNSTGRFYCLECGEENVTFNDMEN